MPKVYTWKFAVRTYELDAHAHVKLNVYQNYLEEAATQASASNGYTYDWYWANKRIWVARKIWLRYYEPALYPDELEVQTWVSDFRRVQSHREYSVRRVRDGAQIVRARTNWVYINLESKRPERLPDTFMDAFAPSGTLEPLDTGIAQAIRVEQPRLHSEERRVQGYELDPAGHVNNSNYAAWVDQAINNALQAVGWGAGRLAENEVVMRPVGREIEFFRGATGNETVRIETRLAEVGRDRAGWRTEIRQAATGELMVADYSVRSFSDARGPRSIPDELYLSLVRPT